METQQISLGMNSPLTHDTQRGIAESLIGRRAVGVSLAKGGEVTTHHGTIERSPLDSWGNVSPGYPHAIYVRLDNGDEYRIGGDILTVVIDNPDQTRQYLSLPQVGERIGVTRSTISSYRRKGMIPPADAKIGDLEGWTEESIDRWQEGRKPRKAGTSDLFARALRGDKDAQREILDYKPKV